ncbi:response regulator [Candidatus Poribacteria bacterium]|nr:response regulator [Candidatus Poribacteria bacterium]
MKVLVVDDSLTMRRIIRNLLLKIGYEEVVEAQDGMEALEVLAHDGNIGLILTDWNMPRMTGIDFVKSVRKDKRFSGIPIIMITTNTSKMEIIQAIAAGVNNYIAKPFTPEIIREKIEQTLKKVKEAS